MDRFVILAARVRPSRVHSDPNKTSRAIRTRTSISVAFSPKIDKRPTVFGHFNKLSSLFPVHRVKHGRAFPRQNRLQAVQAEKMRRDAPSQLEQLVHSEGISVNSILFLT